MFAYKRDALHSKRYIAVSAALALFGGFTVGMCSLFFASGPYGMEVWLSYLSHPLILALNLFVPMLLSAIFFFICNSAVWSFTITNILIIVPSLINYYKLSFRGDCFIATDLTLVSESGKMLESYKLFVDKRIMIYLAVFIAGTVLLAFFARGRFSGRKPRLYTVLCLFALGIAASPLYFSESIYNDRTSNEVITAWGRDSVKYISKGFVYPFIHSARALIPSPPNDYDEEEVKTALAQYEDEKIPEDKQVNIICVMLEAYNDFSRFEELEFTKDVYSKYRELESMGYSGSLVTDIFSGDTKITEREFLTGLPYGYIDDFATPSNSYVWYLRENGYTVEGSHPVTKTFYNRVNINRSLGFENYYFTENYYKEITGGDITWDARLFPLMLDIYKNRDKSKPYFSYSITYQGHGPYSSDTASYEEEYVKSDHVSEGDKNILNNYLNAQASTTEYLYDFATELLATEEPLVLLIFGDHKPWMGNNGSVYTSYGINIDTSSEEGFFNYYSTRYLILANDAAKQLCKNDFSGEGEAMSPCFLLNKVFELCGYGGNQYMQFSRSFAKTNPIVHRSEALSDGEKRLFRDASYYYRRNFIY